MVWDQSECSVMELQYCAVHLCEAVQAVWGPSDYHHGAMVPWLCLAPEVRVSMLEFLMRTSVLGLKSKS